MRWFRDRLHRFMFERYLIRGHLVVNLDAAWRALIEHRDYPGSIREALGEAVGASRLLGAPIKLEGGLSQPMRGDGPRISSSHNAPAASEFAGSPDREGGDTAAPGAGAGADANTGSGNAPIADRSRGNPHG